MPELKFIVKKLLFFLAMAGIAAAQVSISASATVLVGDREPLPLKKAAADLVADFGRLFGSQPRLVHHLSEAAGTTVCVCLNENLPPGFEKPRSAEVLRIQASVRPWKNGTVRNAVILTGSDMRGAIYAVYEFSRQYLGVDPLYYWTDRMPARRSSVKLPDRLSIQAGPPSFRYRGWFLNDEDLLTGWKPGTNDGADISLATWDKVFEAILRLKGNMVVPGTFIFPDEPQVKAASERGLIVSQHHIEVLGTNTFRWPEDRPYSFTSHPEVLISAWTHAAREYRPEQEVIWTLGYRGRHDRAFWRDDPTAGVTDAEHAAAIQRAMEKQIEIVRALRPDPVFIFNAWAEAVPFLQSGLLKVPAGVTLVWPDNGHGVIRDEGAIRAGQGVYYHTAMVDHMANQLTEMLPLERMQRELGRVAKAGATEYLLVNTSDVRPVPLTTRAVMELAWDSRPWVDNPGHAAAYLDKWCREEFGAAAAPALAEYYRAYFSAPGRYGEDETETLADSAYHTIAREFLVRLINGKGGVPRRPPAWRPYSGTTTQGVKSLAEFAAIYVRAAQEAEPRWAIARKLANKARPLIAAGTEDLFLSHVQTQLDVQQYSNHMLLETAQLMAGHPEGGKAAAIARAIADLQAVLEALNRAEFGKWQGFYRNDLFVNVRHTLALAGAYKDKLEGKPPDARIPILVQPEEPYDAIKAYQGSRRVQ
jgi:hypothetical protein